MRSVIATKSALRPCPICGAVRVDVIHTQRFTLPEGSPLPSFYDIVACPGCGLVYADTPASQHDYDRHYAGFSKYEEPTISTGGGHSALDRERLGHLATRLAGCLRPGARILDAGCAGGGLLLALRERGFGRSHGIDASRACVEQARAAGLEATCLPLSSLAEYGAGERFDLIVLSHVLEHVRELHSLLASIVPLLAPDGAVYVETPDASRYAEHAFVPFYFFDPEHINHFDSTRLATLGRTVGLAGEDPGEGTLEIAPGTPYPVCWAFLRPATPGATLDAEPDNRSLRDHVARYVASSWGAPGFAGLSRVASSGRPVVVWGAGSFAQRLFGSGAFETCRVVAVVDGDRSKRGRALAGFTVEAPEAALARQPDAVIVVAVAVADMAVVDEAQRISPGADIVRLAAPSEAR